MFFFKYERNWNYFKGERILIYKRTKVKKMCLQHKRLKFRYNFKMMETLSIHISWVYMETQLSPFRLKKWAIWTKKPICHLHDLEKHEIHSGIIYGGTNTLNFAEYTEAWLMIDRKRLITIHYTVKLV